MKNLQHIDPRGLLPICRDNRFGYRETGFVDKNRAGLDEPAAEMHEQPYQQHTFVCVKTDPSQQAVVNNIAIHHQQIIQGPPGTGKSQSLTAVISNALANHAKCLVVCEKRTALEVVQNNLSVIGLGELTVIMEDIAKDRTKVIDHVRNQIETIGNRHIFRMMNTKICCFLPKNYKKTSTKPINF